MSLGKDSGRFIILRDLSSRGAGISSNFPIDLGQEVQIQIKEPFIGIPVTKDAKVVWSKQVENNLWRCGLDFGQDKLLEIPL